MHNISYFYALAWRSLAGIRAAESNNFSFLFFHLCTCSCQHDKYDMVNMHNKYEHNIMNTHYFLLCLYEIFRWSNVLRPLLLMWCTSWLVLCQVLYSKQIIFPRELKTHWSIKRFIFSHQKIALFWYKPCPVMLSSVYVVTFSLFSLLFLAPFVFSPCFCSFQCLVTSLLYSH